MTDLTTATAEATVEIGDLFADSWGYNQTQVDFYEVVGMTASGKSVRVQSVRQENLTDRRRPTVTVRPIKGTTYGPVETKRLKKLNWGIEGDRYAFRVNTYSSAYQGDWDNTWFVTGHGFGH